MKLLAIDDGLADSKQTIRVARRAGFDVRVAKDSPDFIAQYDAFQPDVVVMEVVLKAIDGLERITWLQDQGSDAHVVIFTEYDLFYSPMSELVMNARDDIAPEVLHKPVDDETLERTLHSIRAAIENGRMQSARPAAGRALFRTRAVND